MKINGRLVKIALVSFVASIAIVAAIYYTMASALAPEPTIRVYTYSKNLEKGMILTQLDIKETIIPKSLYSQDMLQDIKDIIDKKIIGNVTNGEFVYGNKLTDRGRIEQDYDDLYILGLDVGNISNYLGTQLKVGDRYHIIILNDQITSQNQMIEYEPEKDNLGAFEEDNETIEITVISLVDNTGNEVFGSKQSPIKTINIGVQDYEHVKKILSKEESGKLEIVRFPKE